MVLRLFVRVVEDAELHDSARRLALLELLRVVLLPGGASGAAVDEAVQKDWVDRDRLVIHSDNGGPMKGASLLATLQSLGIVPSFSRPRVYDDNPYSEALFRTLKYRPEYPSLPFGSLEEARRWVEGFVRWYNTEHRHSAIRFVTPQVRHAGAESQVLFRRKEVYEAAKRRNPGRWSGTTRNWSPITEVILNPVTIREKDRQRASA